MRKNSLNGPITASKKPRARPQRRLGSSIRRPASARSGSVGDQAGADADRHQHRHRRVRDAPAEVVREIRIERVGDDDRDTVAELIGGRQQPELVGVAGRLDPPRVDDDVLRRRGEGDDQREDADRREAGAEADHRRARRGRCATRIWLSDHPAAPPAEAAEHRRVDAIDDRRPEKLERIGEPDPRQEADRRQRGALRRAASSRACCR